jgi:hypothetical protein
MERLDTLEFIHDGLMKVKTEWEPHTRLPAKSGLRFGMAS